MNEISHSTCVRIFNVYGQFDNLERLIPDIVLKTFDGSKLVLKKPKVSRDFIHVNDVLEAISLLVEKENYINESKYNIYNVGTGISNTVGEVADYIRKITSSILPIEIIPSDNCPENSFPGPIADIKKIKIDLGWEPKLTLENGLKATVEWFKKNTQLYHRL